MAFLPHTKIRNFDPSRPLYALRTLKFGDVTVQANAVIDWKGFGESEDAMKILFNVAQVGHEPFGQLEEESVEIVVEPEPEPEPEPTPKKRRG